MQDFRFEDRVAIVTGAGGNPGLGRSYALLLARRGAKVLVNDLGVGPDGKGGIAGTPDDVVREIVMAGGEALANRDSVASQEGAARIVQAALDTWGRLDILINNAGIAPFALFNEISDADIERVVDVHLMGTIWMCRAAWKNMTQRRFGRIVNVTSSVGLSGATHQSIYSGAKLGIVGFTRAIASEGNGSGIKANCIMPMANTLAWETMLESDFTRQAKEQGLLPEVVAPVAAWLAHERCKVSGLTLGTGAGSVYEIFISRTRGSAPDPSLTIEKVASGLDQALARTDATEYAIPAEAVQLPFAPKPYNPNPRK